MSLFSSPKTVFMISFFIDHILGNLFHPPPPRDTCFNSPSTVFEVLNYLGGDSEICGIVSVPCPLPYSLGSFSSIGTWESAMVPSTCLQVRANHSACLSGLPLTDATATIWLSFHSTSTQLHAPVWSAHCLPSLPKSAAAHGVASPWGVLLPPNPLCKNVLTPRHRSIKKYFPITGDIQDYIIE